MWSARRILPDTDSFLIYDQHYKSVATETVDQYIHIYAAPDSIPVEPIVDNPAS